MTKRNKLQALKTKAIQFKYRPLRRIKLVWGIDHIFKPGMTNPTGRHYIVKNDSVERQSGVAETFLDLASRIPNSEKYTLFPHQQAVIDAIEKTTSETTPEERDYFNMWAQGDSSKPFLKPEILIDSLAQAHEMVPDKTASKMLSDFLKDNAARRAEAKKKLLSVGDTLDIPTGFSVLQQSLEGGFKRGQLTLLGGASRFGMSRHLTIPTNVFVGQGAYFTMRSVEDRVKKDNPEATEAEVFQAINEVLSPLQRGGVWHYCARLKQILGVGIIEEISGSFDAMTEVYKFLNSYIAFVRDSAVPEVASGVDNKSLDNLCPQFPSSLDDESKEEKKNV